MTKKILVIGANGFIGSYITAKLLRHNLEVVCGVRDVESTRRKFPHLEVRQCDFNQDLTPEAWLKRLENIDIVINAAGLLTSIGKNKIDNVHFHGPKALFEACIKANVKRIIHLSALGIEEEHTTEYALTKKSTENYLHSLKNIEWIILQPSLIYASGCYGGTSLFRALATLPYFIPLVGEGTQAFQPIHMDDLTDIVLACVNKQSLTAEMLQKTLKIVGPKTVIMKNILIDFRKWLGLSDAIILKIPLIFIRIGAKFGDILGAGPLNSTSYKMMMQPNVANESDRIHLIEFTGITPRSFEQGLASEPLTVQSLWHARLFFLKPVLKIILGLFWISTGLITAFLAPDRGLQIIHELGFSQAFSQIALYASCFVDIILGLLLIINSKIIFIYVLQILLILGYTAMLTILKPDLWLEPLGPLTKNIPIVFLTLALIAIDRDK